LSSCYSSVAIAVPVLGFHTLSNPSPDADTIPADKKHTFTAELFKFSNVLTHEKSFKFQSFINKSPLAEASKESN